MDTQTTQAFGNENKKEQNENKDNKWSKAAKAAAATAGVVGVAGVAASVMGGDESPVAADEEVLAQAEMNENPVSQDVQENTSSYQHEYESASTTAPAPEPAAATHQAPQYHAPQQTPQHSNVEHHTTAQATTPVPETPVDQPIAHMDAPASTLHETPEFTADSEGIPVDYQWLADENHTSEITDTTEAENLTAQATSTTVDELNQQVPPISQSAMNILTNSVGDDLADKVNVSPEIFMSMMGLKPTDMIQTELNGDGQSHMAALLANDNGQYLLLVDSDGDGFLDTLTDMTGHEYAMLGDGIQFEVNVGEMQAFVHETNPDAFIETSMYASNDVDIASIEGEGNGDEVAYVDEHDIADVPSVDEAMTDDSMDLAQVLFDDDLDQLEVTDDLAANELDDNLDLIGFDDSSMA